MCRHHDDEQHFRDSDVLFRDEDIHRDQLHYDDHDEHHREWDIDDEL